LATAIEPLGKQHDRATFTCGQPALDDWFRRRAGQDEKRNVARVFVAIDDEQRSVLGFYSLSSFTLAIDDLPDEIARKLPRYDAIPLRSSADLPTTSGCTGKELGASYWPTPCAASWPQAVVSPCSQSSSMPKTITRSLSTRTSASGDFPCALGDCFF
jgi:hypothetical protein